MSDSMKPKKMDTLAREYAYLQDSTPKRKGAGAVKAGECMHTG